MSGNPLGTVSGAFLLLVLLAAPAWGADPAAIVEAAPPSASGVQFMDYLEPGRKISLRKGETLVLGYLRSCVQERITGGQVTIGKEMSAVAGGELERRKVECDGGQASLESAQAGKSGAMAYRVEPGKEPARPPRPQVVLFRTSPFIHLPGGGPVVITRLDKEEPPFRARAEKDALDLAVLRKELVPAALYRVEAGGKAVIVGVDPFAAPGGGPIVGRLIRF